MNRSVFKFGEFSGSDCLEFRKGNANAGRKFLLKSGSAFLLDGMGDHSHSILAGGLVVTSYSTRLQPLTSPTMRVAMRPRRS